MVLDDSVMRRNDALREMMRLARSIAADGVVTEIEAKVFRAWIDRNAELRGIRAVDEIVRLLEDAFADGHLTEDEQERLLDLLTEFGG